MVIKNGDEFKITEQKKIIMGGSTKPKTNSTKKIIGAENFRKFKIGSKYYLKNKLKRINFFIKKKFSNRKKTLC